ncbi:Orotidine 5'-phosphate decarboxylase [Xylariomycetidae sp. FL2044]|nr:Orotidine 5'-phosphate decarboxylase [Xylariomycetidae sp. FL2044]
MTDSQSRHPTFKASFADRASNACHPLSNYLLRLMELKKSNLCLSADVPTARELLHLADRIGPSIVILKTHYDIVTGWDFHPQTGTGAKLQSLARKHGFLIFEDRKFGDIGNTVQMQYTGGTARIIDWAHIVNINMIPGKAGVTALKEAAAKWRSRVNYEVKTSVTVGTPVSDAFDDNGGEGEEEDYLSPMEAPTHPIRNEQSGRKGSIVSITTVTQSFEPVDSPRFGNAIAEGDELVCAGIEEPPYERALLILAQMSSQGNFMDEKYTRACQEAARENKDFVMGFISQGTLNSEPSDDFLSMTPGCQLPPEGEEDKQTGDGLGQQYNTPAKLVGTSGSDIIIVGRGIIKANSPQVEAERRIVISCTECHRRKQKCDRKLPCTNCQSRNKESACRYETGTPIAKDDTRNRTGGRASTRSPAGGDSPHENGGAIIKPADFGYTHNGTSTLGMLRRIEGADGGGGGRLPGMPGDQAADGGDSFGMRERYKNLIRQLPARTFVEHLVDIYFAEVNWQYFGVDEPTLRDLMAQWYRLPFNVLSASGPQGLDPMLRALPALLFQMMATSLLYLPATAEGTFESLKYTSNMSFDDLAFDYSESGVAVLSLLGKRQMSIVTVLAGFVRAAFLKYTGMVTESWHQIGTCIRDAQEIGLHRDQMDPQPMPDDSTEAALEKIWTGQTRRRTWMLLLGWDLHTGAVLGRPTSVDYRLMSRSPPIDAVIPKNHKTSPLLPRSEADPPTPLTRAIWAWEMLRPLREILDLEKEGPFPKDFSRVEKIHRELLDLKARTPGPFRLENPDTQFDDLPECWWLPLARPTLPQILSFNVMALHRPVYVFTRPASREVAVQASLEMLEAQRLYFEILTPEQHKTFALFFGTFDAIVMMASIYILFPREQPDLLPRCHQHFSWAIERFEKMAERNRLARAALGVLHAIYIRFKKASSGSNPPPRAAGGNSGMSRSVLQTSTSSSSSLSRTPGSNSDAVYSSSSHRPSVASSVPTTSTSTDQQGTSPNTTSSTGLTPASVGSSGGGGGGSGNPVPDSNNMFAAVNGGGDEATTSTAATTANTLDWSLPTDFDFGSLMPMYPMGDIAYNDLTGVMLGDLGSSNGGDGSSNNREGGGGAGTGGSWGDGGGGGGGAGTGGSWGDGGGGGGGGGTINHGMPGLHMSSVGQEQIDEVPWQFGGEFGVDTIWNLLNQFPAQ